MWFCNLNSLERNLYKLKPEDQWSCSSPETICSEQAYGNIFKE